MNELTTQSTFEERMKSRIRESIGELMTDEELGKIVSRCTEEVFFKPIKVNGTYSDRFKPPAVHQIIEELLAEKVKQVVAQYIKANEEKLMVEVNKVITAGIGNAVLSAIQQRFEMELNMFQSNIITNIQNR